MPRAKVAISLAESTLRRLDLLVRQAVFPNRSQAIQCAVEEKLERLERSRLARECGILDPVFEKALAEEGMSEDLSQWPVYSPGTRWRSILPQAPRRALSVAIATAVVALATAAPTTPVALTAPGSRHSD